jgi:hypothetical protein
MFFEEFFEIFFKENVADVDEVLIFHLELNDWLFATNQINISENAKKILNRVSNYGATHT